MSKFSMFVGPRAARLGVACLVATLLGGCASDVSRFSDPFSNPFSSASRTDPAATGSVASAAPVAPVQSRPLATTYPSYGAHPNGSAAASPQGSAAPRQAAQIGGTAEGWSPAGGTPIVVADGENLSLLSERYGVPAAALLKANSFSSSAQVRPGTRLIVPVYHGGTAQAERDVTERPRVAARDPDRKKLARDEKPTREEKTKVALAEPRKPDKTPKPEKTASAKHVRPGAPAAEQPVQSASAKPTSGKVASAPLAKTQVAAAAPAAKPAVTGTDPTPTASLPPTSAEAAKPEFRWPARGRIIQGFKPGGNDGINIAVPEGTSVKAAEAGVVAYAGSELKGYGNMILIRHPNGFVSAYANNGELDVKRGDQVKRGQIIAKSGQSGNVSAPQLHFELRKGSTPVDPTGYLAGL